MSVSNYSLLCTDTLLMILSIPLFRRERYDAYQYDEDHLCRPGAGTQFQKYLVIFLQFPRRCGSVVEEEYHP